jgi:hypothetical protein
MHMQKNTIGLKQFPDDTTQARSEKYTVNPNSLLRLKNVTVHAALKLYVKTTKTIS